MKRFILWMPALLVLLIFSLVIAGCDSGTGIDTASEDSSAEGEGVEDGDQPIYGMIIKYPDAPYVQAMIHGAREKAEELGVTVDVRDGEGDNLQILDLIDTFIQKGIDGFILAGTIEQKGLVPGIEKLNELGIPVMALDTSPEGGKVELFISFDLYEVSKKAADQMVEGIKERNNGEVPAGIIINIIGNVENMWTPPCNQGLEDALAPYPQLEIVMGEGHYNNVDAFEITSDLLTRHGDDVVAIFCQTPDIMGPGTVNAIESAGLNPGDYGITGICMGPEGVELIKEGKVLSIVAQPAMASAELAVQYIYNLNNNLPVPQIGDTVEREGALWSPAQMVESPWADGGYMILNAPAVPQEVDVDNSLLWENRLSHLW